MKKNFLITVEIEEADAATLKVTEKYLHTEIEAYMGALFQFHMGRALFKPVVKCLPLDAYQAAILQPQLQDKE